MSAETLYTALATELEEFWAGERDFFCRAATMAAVLFWRLPEINWVGFYLRDGEELVLGPFQGQPACQRIRLGDGVCGKAAQEQRTILVPDVRSFSGYIACNPETLSELVVPLVTEGLLYGVLDLDSPRLGRFTAEDAVELERLATQLLAAADRERLHRYYYL